MKFMILREGIERFEFIPRKEIGGFVVPWQEWKSIMGDDERLYERLYERELEAVDGKDGIEVKRFRREWEEMVQRMRGDFESLC